MASRYSNDPHAVLLSPPPEVDVAVSAHASDVIWPMDMGTRQQIELAKARNATVSALRGMRKLESEVNALKGRLQDVEMEKEINEKQLKEEIDRLRASDTAAAASSGADDDGDEEIPDEGDSTVSIVQPTEDSAGSRGSKRIFDQAMEQTLELAKQEGESNRFMMGPPEGQSVTLEMVNRALANGCKERDEEITRLKVMTGRFGVTIKGSSVSLVKGYCVNALLDVPLHMLELRSAAAVYAAHWLIDEAKLERVTNELNELRTRQRMQKSDKGESSSSEVEDTNEVGAKSNGPAEDWKTVVRSTAEGDDEREKEAAPEGKNVAKATGVERRWYEKLFCFSSHADAPVETKSRPTKSSPPVMSARTEATTAPHSP
ncbi:hypothetical protein FOZ61_005789 [Perkinsus olseni]|uniref:Uncharacterized protein n=2 Tax=Perkinsus olseni TaxID=32597 RepID=A0A7J6MCM9_PEROL|nr:hypothetical protein FOZ61_005789 [Perkinsus olseni]